MDDGTLLVRWEHHHAELVSRLHGYLAEDAFVDVTLWCEGRRFRAHRLLLSACCDFFEQVLLEERCGRGAVSVVLRGLDPEAVSALLEVMYRGEARVPAPLLPHLLHAVRTLGVRLPPPHVWQPEPHQGQGLKRNSMDDTVQPSVQKMERDTPPSWTGDSPQVTQEQVERPTATGEHCSSEDSSQQQQQQQQQHSWRDWLRSPQDSVVQTAQQPDVGAQQTSQTPSTPKASAGVGLASTPLPQGIRQQLHSSNLRALNPSPSVASLPPSEEHPLESQDSHQTLWTTKKMQDTEDESQCLQYQSQNYANNRQNSTEQHELKQQGQRSTQADHSKTCVSPNSLKTRKLENAGEKPYVCSQCGRRFSQRRNLRYHMSLHSGSREFAADCPQCGKTVSNRNYLTSHMKIHRNKREYACGECGRRFNQCVAYRTHVRLHSGHRPHHCAVCDRAFSRKSLLQLHMRTHTGEKPFKCEVCGKQFSDRSNMVVHARAHSGVKPYSCDLCGRSYSRRGGLVSHMVSAHLKGAEAAAAVAQDPPSTATRVVTSQPCSVITRSHAAS